MSDLPRVLYIARSDKGGGAEERLNKTAQSYPGTLAVYVKFNHKSWEKVKTLSTGILDKVFNIVDSILSLFFRKRIHIKSKLFISEKYNQTWSKIKNLPEFWECNLVHISNLHTNYFDLDALRKITKYKPVLLNVSDLWLVTGGEAHSPNDNGFKTGNAKTNDISLYPCSSPWVDKRQTWLKKKRALFEQIKENLYFATNSKWTEQQFLESWVMRFGPNYRTIIPGVDTEVFANKAKRDWSTLRVAFFNSQSQYKNGALILDALEQVNTPIELYLIGSEIYLNNSNITVKYIGAYIYEKEKVAELYNQVDVLVYPSVSETFGMMVAEAKACGVCVIGSANTAIEEQIEEKRTGLLVDRSSINEISDKLQWCAQALDQVREIGRNAAKDVLQNYTLDRYLLETMDYYKYISRNRAIHEGK